MISNMLELAAISVNAWGVLGAASCARTGALSKIAAANIELKIFIGTPLAF
jgi:hypothetical protein